MPLSTAPIILFFHLTRPDSGVIIFRVASEASLMIVDDPAKNALYTSILSSVINSAAIMILGFVSVILSYVVVLV